MTANIIEYILPEDKKTDTYCVAIDASKPWSENEQSAITIAFPMHWDKSECGTFPVYKLIKENGDYRFCPISELLFDDNNQKSNLMYQSYSMPAVITAALNSNYRVIKIWRGSILLEFLHLAHNIEKRKEAELLIKNHASEFLLPDDKYFKENESRRFIDVICLVNRVHLRPLIIVKNISTDDVYHLEFDGYFYVLKKFDVNGLKYISAIRTDQYDSVHTLLATKNYRVYGFNNMNHMLKMAHYIM